MPARSPAMGDHHGAGNGASDGMSAMPENDETGPIHRWTPLAVRIEAVERFADCAEHVLTVTDPAWSDVAQDYRLLAVNSSLRRQQDSIRAALLLSRHDLGHLAVAFVRAALDDVMYLRFFASLDRGRSQELFASMSNFDSLRALLAQRNYIGDTEMARLWYPKPFLDWAVAGSEETRAVLRRLKKQYGWTGGLLPPGMWVADRAGQRELYDYLSAASSRAVHFSAGEIMRRGWIEPTGKLVTDKPAFREHLACFALDRLWRLYLDTWQVAAPMLERAGISNDHSLRDDEMITAIARLRETGSVPLVHAHEWKLPRRPLRPDNKTPGAPTIRRSAPTWERCGVLRDKRKVPRPRRRRRGQRLGPP
ncbi:hypothetical protein JOJ86_005289 [Rhodococcus percolatus]|nr:hypothetical protein [Rhodococcus opacus]MBA8964474.1 hypothetical protein [Rhodococcus opacus]MBP2207563.1 hypothetical protein [Rhodococcus opacus]